LPADPPALRSSPHVRWLRLCPLPAVAIRVCPSYPPCARSAPAQNAHFGTASARSTVSTHRLILPSPGAPAPSQATACRHPHTGTGASTYACTRPRSRSRPNTADAAVSRWRSFDVSSSFLLLPPPRPLLAPRPSPNLSPGPSRICDFLHRICTWLKLQAPGSTPASYSVRCQRDGVPTLL
jgi:hypothetical protein